MPSQSIEGPAGRIAVQHLPGKGPGVVFLPGFRSDMLGSKAEAVAQWCDAQGIACTRMDYRAHGQSEGKWEEFTIGGALADVLRVLDTVAQGPQILVGSSMGGWLSLLAAQERREQVAGIIGIAAAPDFTERGIWARMSAAQRETMEREGEIRERSEYWGDDNVYTRALIEDGRRHLLLDGPIDIACPVRLLQGMCDDSVPWETALVLTSALTGEDVQLQLVKDGDHRLYRPEDIALLMDGLARLHERVQQEITS